MFFQGIAWRLVLLMAALLVSTLSNWAWSDDASLGRVGGGVQPLSQTAVQMLAEDVKVKVTAPQSAVDATFTFLNQGPAVDLLVGFPQASGPADPEREEFRDDTKLHDFRARVNGREVPVQLEASAITRQVAPIAGTEEAGNLPFYPAWHTFSLRLAAGEKAEVRNTYWVKNTSWSNGEVETGYVLRSGSTWAGKIGRGRIEFSLEGIAPYQVLGGRPGNWRLAKENTYVWEFADWKPDRDITLHFSSLTSRFQLPEIDDKLRQDRYSELLSLVEQALKGAGLPEEKRQALLFRQALALQNLGRLQEARALWEANLALPWLANTTSTAWQATRPPITTWPGFISGKVIKQASACFTAWWCPGG